MNNAEENEDEVVVAEVDRENLRRQLSRERTKINAFPKGRTGPLQLKIPPAWRRFANGDPCVLYDSGRSEDRVIMLSSPFMMEV